MDISKITVYYFCIQENVYRNMWKYFFLPPQVISSHKLYELIDKTATRFKKNTLQNIFTKDSTFEHEICTIFLSKYSERTRYPT